MEKPGIPRVGRCTKPPFHCINASVSDLQKPGVTSHIDPLHSDRRRRMEWVEDILDPEDVV
jgi:hypothetical protein